MDDQIRAVVKNVMKFINAETCKILVTSLVFSQLDYYCNALLLWFAQFFSRLQRFQNSAARLMTCALKICPHHFRLH